MKYKNAPDYKQDCTPCTGVLITNLGTPDAPDATALRRYLSEFLSDPRVIEVPRLIWWFVLHGIILRVRPGRSAAAYKKIWTETGSPLLDISVKQVAAIQTELDKKKRFGQIKVELAMRYGNPSIQSGLERLHHTNAHRILVFPLYPQYSATTTASSFDAVVDTLKTWRRIPELRMVKHYHENPAYINALISSIEQHWQHYARPEKLVFSFHGIPKHYSLAGDPYYDECHKTARLVTEKLGLNEDEWQVTFQSRFGPREWLQPYTDKTVIALGKKGIKHLQILCPGFSADCLETLEEINMQNRRLFTDAGGEVFSYIPALNDNPAHISALANIIQQHIQGWGKQHEDLKQGLQYAKAPETDQ